MKLGLDFLPYRVIIIKKLFYIKIGWKHSSAGMSVRLTRERSGVRASLLPFLLFKNAVFSNLALTQPGSCGNVYKCVEKTQKQAEYPLSPYDNWVSKR